MGLTGVLIRVRHFVILYVPDVVQSADSCLFLGQLEYQLMGPLFKQLAVCQLVVNGALSEPCALVSKRVCFCYDICVLCFQSVFALLGHCW